MEMIAKIDQACSEEKVSMEGVYRSDTRGEVVFSVHRPFLAGWSVLLHVG